MYLQPIVDLVGNIAWPAVILILGSIARKEIRGIVNAFAKRINTAASLKLGLEGLVIKNEIEAVQGRMESLQTDQEQIKELTLQFAHTNNRQIDVQKEISEGSINPELMKMADDYYNINISDYGERVRAKDAMARKMANYAITHRISKDLLAAQHDEGLILALASYIHAAPEPGDIDMLMRVTDETNRLHVKYRIVMAFGRLFERGLAQVSDVASVKDILEYYTRDADSSLIRRIRHTGALIKQITSPVE